MQIIIILKANNTNNNTKNQFTVMKKNHCLYFQIPSEP